MSRKRGTKPWATASSGEPCREYRNPSKRRTDACKQLRLHPLTIGTKQAKRVSSPLVSSGPARKKSWKTNLALRRAGTTGALIKENQRFRSLFQPAWKTLHLKTTPVRFPLRIPAATAIAPKGKRKLLDAGALRKNCFCPILGVAYSEIRPLCTLLALVSGKRPALVQSSYRSTCAPVPNLSFIVNVGNGALSMGAATRASDT